MPLLPPARRIVTLLLVATLVPVPGLAWRAPRATGGAPIDAASLRIFLEALNATESQAMTASNRPQVYMIFNVNLAASPAGSPSLVNAGWFDEFITALQAAPQPAESILDEIAASDAQVRAMQSATRLASMPDSIPFERNPNDGVAVEQSMRVAISDALQAAGFEANGSTKSGAGTVTYTDELADGDIVVTGRLVGGQIVLTKEFKPLTGSGAAGEPVRIRGTNTAPATPAAPLSTVSTANTATPTTAPASTPMDASPSAYNKALMSELEAAVRVVTPNQQNAALMGQIHVRDTYVAQMNNMAAGLETLLNDPARLDTVVRDLRNGAAAVDNAYQNMLGAEGAVATLQGQNPRIDLKGQYEADMRRAAQLEAAGNVTAANDLRTQARNTAYGNFVERQQQFYQALDQNPLLGLGERNLVRPDDFLFKALRNTLAFNAPNSDYVTLTRPYLQRAAKEARTEASRAGAINTAEGFLEFGSPKYDRTRDAMAAEGQANGSTLPTQLGQAAEGAYEQVQGARAIRTEVTNFGLNLVAGTAWVLPFIGPFISGGAAAIQVVREGDDLVVAVLDAEDARNLANVTGYTRVLTTEDRVAAERGEFVLSVAGLALEGLQGIKVVKGPRAAGAGNAAGDAAVATTNTTGDAAAAATRNASAPAPDKTQVFPDPPGTGGRVESPGQRLSAAEVASADAAELAELAEVYDANLAAARAAGVSEDRIKQITAGATRGDPDVANVLYREALVAEGKQLNMPLSEYGEVKMFQTRSQLGTLTEADYQWLRNKLATDPNYLDNLPNRGRLTTTPKDPNPIDDFDPSLTTAQRDALMQDPRVSQLVQDAKTATAAADNTGTTMLPAGSQPGPGDPTVRIDPPASAPTVRVDQADATPTVVLDRADATPTVRVDRADATPTVKVDPADTTPTVRLDRPDNAPTVRVDPADATPTVKLDPQDAAPTVKLDPNATAPTVQLGPGSGAPTVRTGTEATAPTVRTGPEATAPTVRTGPEATAPTVRTGPAATAPTVRTGPAATAPTVRTGPAATAPTVRTGAEAVAPTVRVSNELAETLPKLQHSGRAAADVAREVRATINKLGVEPKQLISTLMPRMASRLAKPVAMASLGNTATPAPGLTVAIDALGVASGDAFKITAMNSGAVPVQLQGEGIVVEPIVGGPRPGPAFTAAASASETVEAFCLERVRPVAPPGTQYRVAPPAVQSQHARLVDILHAAERVQATGLLRPDSEAKGYFNFIRQWSIWTKQENFDEKRFTEEFLNQTKKNVESQQVKWTDAMQGTVRKAAPGRWRDINSVLDEANKPKIQASAGAVFSRPVISAAFAGVWSTPALPLATRRRLRRDRAVGLPASSHA